MPYTYCCFLTKLSLAYQSLISFPPTSTLPKGTSRATQSMPMSCRASSRRGLLMTSPQTAEGLQLCQKLAVHFMVLQCLFVDGEEGMPAGPAIGNAVFRKSDCHGFRKPSALFRQTDKEHGVPGHNGVFMETPLVFVHSDDTEVGLQGASLVLHLIFPDQVENFIGQAGIGPGRYDAQSFFRRKPLLSRSANPCRRLIS